jgi:hypothetical protein
MADWLRDLEAEQWYQTADGPFEVVGIDVDNEVVLVQHFDGGLEEFDFDTWIELRAKPIPPPEDWSGAMDCERADCDVEGEVEIPHPGRWDLPLDRLDALNARRR